MPMGNSSFLNSEARPGGRHKHQSGPVVHWTNRCRRPPRPQIVQKEAAEIYKDFQLLSQMQPKYLSFDTEGARPPPVVIPRGPQIPRAPGPQPRARLRQESACT